MKKLNSFVGLCLTVYLLVATLPNDLSAQVVAKKTTTSTGQVFAFLMAKPTTHNLSPANRKYPLIIFLHGGGALQSNDTSISPGAPVWDLTGWGPMREVGWQNNNLRATLNNQPDTFNVLQPLGPVATTWPPAYISAMIKYATDSLKTDTNRIYLCGHSWGGAGVFNYLNVSSANAKKLAAAVTVSAWNTGLHGSGPANVSAAKLPLWGFHALDDVTTKPDTTQFSINRLNAVNPQVKPLLTMWRAGVITPHPHNTAPEYVFSIHEYPYLEDGVLNIYEWFLGQNKSLPVNVLPVANVGNDLAISTTPGTATLNGSGSTDGDGTIVRYVWRKISGPAGGTIATPFGTASSTTVSGLTTVGVYKFQLNVVDNRAAIARDTLTITVSNSPNGYGKAVHTGVPAGRVYTNTDVTQLTSASKFTLEALIKIDSTSTDWTTIIRKGYNFTHRIMFHVGPGDNSIHCFVSNGASAYGKTTANAITVGVWYHVAFVYDGTQTGNANRLKLYINGVAQTLSFDGTTIPATTSSLLAGQTFTAGANLGDGNVDHIDEVRVWNTALSATTISDWKDKLLGSCHPNFANLVLYWPLNNNSNPTIATAGLGTAYSGTLTNASYENTSVNTDTVSCPGMAVHTGVPAGRVYTNTDVTQLTSASKFTLEALIKIDSTSTDWTTIIRKGYNFTHRIMFHVGPGDNSIHCFVSNGASAYGKTTANAITVGVWYHVAFVYDGTQTGNANRLKLYINGVAQTLSFDGTTIPATTSSLLAGQTFTAGANLGDGNVDHIDEVRVWNTALSATTISDWKDKLLGSCHPNFANLVLYWPLNNNSNPTIATAGLGTAYSGTLTNASYENTTVTTSDNDCSMLSMRTMVQPEQLNNSESVAGKIYPNPAQGHVQLEMNALTGQSVYIYVIDMNGRCVYTKQARVAKGGNRIHLNISSLNSGSYLVSIRANNYTLKEYKLVKQ